MNIEETSALERRVRRHAALADAARLRMVDLLTIGDRSPTELREHLALPSNLVAHHLNVLERAGIITRVRSEGDGRRSYVRLDAGALPDLDPQRAISVPRIVFVCTANSARSQLARAIWGTVRSLQNRSRSTNRVRGSRRPRLFKTSLGGSASSGPVTLIDACEPVDPMGGRPMKEWVVVPEQHAKTWLGFARAALAYRNA